VKLALKARGERRDLYKIKINRFTAVWRVFFHSGSILRSSPPVSYFFVFWQTCGAITARNSGIKIQRRPLKKRQLSQNPATQRQIFLLGRNKFGGV
jgi:hypothetical protein